MDKYRFFVLLAALSALLFAAPLVREFSPTASPLLSRVVIAGLFVAMLLSAVLAVGRTRLTTNIAIALAAPLIVFQFLQIVFRYDGVDIPTHLFEIVFLGYVICIIIRYLFAISRVTSNTICSAICVYLLLGVLWAIVLSAVDLLIPNSFTTSMDGVSMSIRFGGEQSVDALYFSFVTLTTLGYGDITPTSPTAKMLVTMEAVVGQLFLAVLVARLVGLHISHSASHPPQDDES